MKLLPLDSCGLMLSYRCQCGCRHCVYACGPSWREWMNPEDLEKLLHGIKNTWVNPKGLHLAGGEAFLNFELLCFGVRKCQELGLKIEYVETNAGWCLNKEEGRQKFSILRDLGLERILISVSPFHAETIPLKRTLAAIEAAQEVFGAEGVIIYMAHFLDLIARFGKERPVPLKEWIKLYGSQGAGRLFWEGYALIPGGRAGLELGHLAPRKYLVEELRGINCASEILFSRHAHFDPYLNYIPLFCGGLSLGKVRDLSSFVTHFDYRKHTILKILVEDGPYGLFRFAKENFGFEPNPLGYAGKCHLCVEVRNFLVRQGDFPELSPKAFYQSLRSHLPSLEEE